MTKTEKKTKKGGLWQSLRQVMPTVCNVFGILTLLAVFVIALPLSVPRMFGYDIFVVLTPSMSPEIPMGSIVYAAQTAPELVEPGEVIVYGSLNDTITHRVVENRMVEGKFITKGDANPDVDEPVPYDKLVGKVTFSLPVYGEFMNIYSSMLGKIYLIGFALIGVMLNLLASRLRARLDEEDEENEPEEDEAC